MKYINKIGITFKNCEYIEIPDHQIEEMILQDFEPWIGRIACNAIIKTDKCNQIYLQFAPQANVMMPRLFGQPSDTNFFFRVIGHPDITSVTCFYNDDTKETFYVNWKDAKNNNTCNANQYNKFTDNDSLCIMIVDSSQTKVFEKELALAEDKDYVNHLRDTIQEEKDARN